MVETDRQKILRLETELAELKTRLIPENPEPMNVAPIEEGTTIRYPRSTDVDLPNRDECVKLMAIVARAFPRFEFEIESREFLDGFTASMWRLGQLKRSDKLSRVNDWAIETDNFLHQPGGMRGNCLNGSFFAAVMASGDIKFMLGNASQGISPKAGLDYNGTPARAAWREVLERGSPRQPAPSVDHSRSPSSPAEVRFF
jgi:hypothetical protein